MGAVEWLNSNVGRGGGPVGIPVLPYLLQFSPDESVESAKSCNGNE